MFHVNNVLSIPLFSKKNPNSRVITRHPDFHILGNPSSLVLFFFVVYRSQIKYVVR